jgi:opacity protein-like surface antigen
MKKSLIALSIIASLTSGAAFAKTEGSYLGLSVINTELENNSYNDEARLDSSRDNNFSGGVSYKYAFNFNGFFAAPELFFDLNETKSRASLVNNAVQNSELKNSYGAKLNLGYDITDKFSAYAIVGHSVSRLKAYASGAGASDYEGPQNFNQEAFIYGLGAKYDVANNISLNFSYEISQFSLSNDVTNTTDKINPDFSVARVGVAYNF